MIKSKKQQWLIYGSLIVASLVVLYPFFFMIINSFKNGVRDHACPECHA